MEKIRVLQVVGSLERGGLQTTVMNIIRFSPKNYRFDILVCESDGGEFEEEASELGCKIWHCKNPAKDMVSFLRICNQILSGSDRYHIIHSHIYLASGIVLFLSRFYKIPVRIAHIHSVKRSTEQKHFVKIKNSILRILLKKSATVFCACSVKAGNEAFGEKLFRDKGIIFPNFVRIQNFVFDKNERILSRKTYGVRDDQFVIGQVANFTNEKNQMFLLKVFERYVGQYDDKAILVLVGDGNNRPLIEKMIAEAHIEKNVILTGRLERAEAIYHMFDIFVISSLHEGFCMALLEAEINGLPFVVERNVLVDELKSLGNGIIRTGYKEVEWCEAIREAKEMGRYEQINVQRRFRAYDIQRMGKFIDNLYWG